MKTLNRNLILKAAAPAILAIAISLVSVEGAQAGNRNTVGISLDLDGIAVSYVSSVLHHPRPVVLVPAHSHGPRHHYAPAPPRKNHHGHFRSAPERHHGPKVAHKGLRPGHRR